MLGMALLRLGQAEPSREMFRRCIEAVDTMPRYLRRKAGPWRKLAAPAARHVIESPPRCAPAISAGPATVKGVRNDMKPSIVQGLALAIGVAAAGCSGESTPPPASTMAAQPAATAPAAAAAGDFGVPACDQYMRKYAACVDSKVPEGARAMMKESMMQTHLAWKQAASTPRDATP